MVRPRNSVDYTISSWSDSCAFARISPQLSKMTNPIVSFHENSLFLTNISQTHNRLFPHQSWVQTIARRVDWQLCNDRYCSNYDLVGDFIGDFLIIEGKAVCIQTKHPYHVSNVHGVHYVGIKNGPRSYRTRQLPIRDFTDSDTLSAAISPLFGWIVRSLRFIIMMSNWSELATGLRFRLLFSSLSSFEILEDTMIGSNLHSFGKAKDLHYSL
jgi:hypothetical protein